MPHRCELIDGKGEVILSGDPVEDRPDLFWDTKERIGIDWPTGIKVFYRATNPHSGCFCIKNRLKRYIDTGEKETGKAISNCLDHWNKLLREYYCQQ